MNGSEPQPAKPFVGSIALVRRLAGDAEEWLALWDEEADQYRLPQAQRSEGESFRTCLIETLETCLQLDRKSDFIIAGLSRAHFQAPIEWPDEEYPQWVIVEFFAVDLYGKQSRQQVEQLPGVRWLSLREVARGVTCDADLICPRQRTLIERADILPAALSNLQ